MTREELVRLAEEYRDGGISEADAQRLADGIRTGGSEAEAILDELEFGGVISQALDDSGSEGFVRTFRERLRAEDGAEDFTTKFRNKHLKRSSRRKRTSVRRRKTGSWFLPIVLAASLALAVGAIWWSRGNVQTEPTFAMLMDVRGNVMIERDGRATTATSDASLLSSDRLKLGTDGFAAVVFEDGTQIHFNSDSKAALKADAGAKRLELNSGTLQATVAKQPQGKPMLFVTPHATATVLGTSFRLVSQSNGTRLDVTEGNVRLSLPDSIDGLDVTHGRSAEATANGTLAFLTPQSVIVAEKKIFGPASGRPFNDESPWNAAIPADPVLDADSTAIVRNVSKRASTSMYRFAVPIFHADINTPVRKVTTTLPWGTSPFAKQEVRIPDSAKPNSGNNASFMVIDWHARRTWEFYKFTRVGSDAKTAWGGTISIDGDGVKMAGAGTAGASMLAGLVRVHEIEDGSIEHALNIASEFAKAREVRFPGHKSDGDYTGPGALPVGARLQLDPTIDVDAIPGISRGEIIIAKALQKHGAYCIGKTDVPILINFELAPDARSNSQPGKVYSASGFSGGPGDLTHIPWNRLRVLKNWDGK